MISKEAIITRYDTYMEKTKPVLDFYSRKVISMKLMVRSKN